MSALRLAGSVGERVCQLCPVPLRARESIMPNPAGDGWVHPYCAELLEANTDAERTADPV